MMLGTAASTYRPGIGKHRVLESQKNRNVANHLFKDFEKASPWQSRLRPTAAHLPGLAAELAAFEVEVPDSALPSPPVVYHP